MAAHISSPSSDDSKVEQFRKRVCKACDRCRLRKSKCDGAKPCLRCRSDNTICVFGERKKDHKRAYPQGLITPRSSRYAEKLEEQQQWLVHGLQELYRRITEDEAWAGDRLSAELNDRPSVHNILNRLGALDHRVGQRFEQNTELIQQSLWRENKTNCEKCNDSFEGVQSHVVNLQIPLDASLEKGGSSRPFKQAPLLPTTQPTISSIKDDVSIHTPQSPTSQYGPAVRKASNCDNFLFLDDMDMMATPDYSNFVFNELFPPSPFNSDILMDFNPSSEYEEPRYFTGCDPTEMTSIYGKEGPA
ncbi:hypothetical protein N7466_009656 [Penicillium verhagenii]|uniref:uncharacterized protein n=1 Tax=Penicillium verhagenii TaxID=1562060 RepID=UPI00254586D8|nr:uncharacterized protein N7466_009656 [Penicillium verhagenii]KAJ5921330.1 hypothetical protein N7466_009656 [Penicillium verhagenii]